MSNFTESMLRTHAQSALLQTGQWIERFGGRLAGSPANQKTANELCAELKKSGAQAKADPFTTHPDTFTQFYRIHAGLYFLALVFLFVNLPFFAAITFTMIIAGLILEFGRYVEFYDRFFPAKSGYNVTAVLEPKGEPRQQLIFSGHHDSARELKFLRKWQKWYGLRIILPEMFHFLGAGISWSWVLWESITRITPPFAAAGKWALLIGMAFVLSKVFMFSREVSPGAGDNLIASAIVVELAKIFADPHLQGQSTLQHTRLILASFDAEESGVRGSRAWVKANRHQINQLPTWAFNIDSIYKVADLQCLTSDLNHHVALDKEFAQHCVDIAAKQGISVRLARMRYGGGATDAVELARAGVRATTLIGMSSEVVRDGLVYHTTLDTVDAIEPAAVEAALNLAANLAQTLDQAVTSQ